MHVRVGHVNFGSQHHAAFVVFAFTHLLKQAQVLLNGTIAVRTWRSRFGGRSLLLGNLFRRLLIHIRLARFNQLYGIFVQRLEVIACVVLPSVPFEPKPRNVFSDGIDIGCIFFHWIGVVKTQIDCASILLCQTKIHANRLGVADV